MKLLCSLIASCFLFLSAGRPTNNSVVGSWRLCKEHSNGIDMTRNYCPEVIFYDNGTGTCEWDVSPGNFKWKTQNDTIRFYLNSERDKEIFHFHETEYTFEIYTETFKETEITSLKLTHSATNSWYLLGKEKQ